MDHSLESTLLHMSRVRLVQEYPAQINACLDALADEQVWWRPNEQANAVGNLLVHLIGSNHYYLGHAIGGEVLHRDRDAEFAARGTLPKAELRQAWDGSVRNTQSLLDSLDASQMSETTDRTGKTTSFAQILLHVTHHNAAHMGQIVWVTKMLQPGALDDIWRKGRR